MKINDYELWHNPLSGGVPVKGWTVGVPLEDEAVQQLANTARMPFIFKHVAVMPDAHWGMGACVGSVIPTQDAVIPAAVGVDIGCGMLAIRLGLKRVDFEGMEDEVYKAILDTVPTGRTDNGGPRDKGSWSGFTSDPIPASIQTTWLCSFKAEYEEMVKDDPALARAKTVQHLGTLGGGNHFIELAFDENQDVWLVIHSGSRGIGNKIGSHFIKLAKDLCKKWYIDLPDPNLAYLVTGTPEFTRYMRAVDWAQRFAWQNRIAMADLAINAICECLFVDINDNKTVHCHHNYVTWEKHFGKNIMVTRKGAVAAWEGQRGIIPGSMGERSFITVGKGNPEAFKSSSHGAGRVMSRTEARKVIDVEQHLRDTYGVTCNKSAEVLDESPGAYKDIERVMAAQHSLVSWEHTLRAFINVKGVSEGRKREKKNA